MAESVGTLVDKLSVLALRVEAMEQRQDPRLPDVLAQRQELADELDELLLAYRSGAKQPRARKAHKVYG